jgi:hypothetical protein
LVITLTVSLARKYLMRGSAAANSWQIAAVPSVEALSLMTISRFE